jgi:hypothetical protein
MPEKVAIMARIVAAHRNGWAKDYKYELEPVVPRPRLRICTKHPRIIQYDDETCPCCELMRENFVSKKQAEADFLRLTSERS